MSVPQTGATIIIFCVCGTYIFVTIVLLVKYLLQYCNNRNIPEHQEIPQNHWRSNAGVRDHASFIYGARPSILPQFLPIEHPPAFNEALTCPSPIKVSCIQVDEDELPSYSDYERLYASKVIPTQTQTQISSDNHEIIMTDFNTGKF